MSPKGSRVTVKKHSAHRAVIEVISDHVINGYLVACSYGAYMIVLGLDLKLIFTEIRVRGTSGGAPSSTEHPKTVKPVSPSC